MPTPGRSGWTGSSVEARNGKGGSQSSTLTKFIDWCNGRSARQMGMTAVGAKRTFADLPKWTGDIGLAIYLWDCITGDARFPTIDVF